jgi:hypothetical protein
MLKKRQRNEQTYRDYGQNERILRERLSAFLNQTTLLLAHENPSRTLRAARPFDRSRAASAAVVRNRFNVFGGSHLCF